MSMETYKSQSSSAACVKTHGTAGWPVRWKAGAAGVPFEMVRIDDLPLYNQDDDANQAGQRAAAEGAVQRRRACCSPRLNTTDRSRRSEECDRSRLASYGKSAWRGKLRASSERPRVLGTVMAQQHLRGVLAA